ncbi:MAG: O-antigen ligase family protein [Pseudomonadota bacterium]
MAISDTAPNVPVSQQNGIHVLARLLVWVTVALSGFVLIEPAPVDVLSIGLVIALPIVGLVAFRQGLVAIFVALAILGAAGLIGSLQARDFAEALTHSSVSLYLFAAALALAAFVAFKPLAHARLIAGALMVAGTVSAAAGLIGYAEVFPGAGDLFTRFDRASGTFKDPNVFGAFLVVPLMLALHSVLTGRRVSVVLTLFAAAIMLLALLLSFSRGALLNLAVAGTVYAYLAFVTAKTHRRRFGFAILFGLALSGALAIASVALQNPEVSAFFTERVQWTQSYDVGPEGRFGGQLKAFALLLENPLGIGALEFAPRFHPEDPHNVYLAMFLNAGWLGGFVYLAVILGTLVLGFRHALKRTAHQELFLVVYALFVGLAVVGLLVDTDHWRHFFMVAALVWGLMAARQRPAQVLARTREPRIRGRIVKAKAPRRRQTILGPARRRIRKLPPQPRRPREWRPRRPERIASAE